MNLCLSTHAHVSCANILHITPSLVSHIGPSWAVRCSIKLTRSPRVPRCPLLVHNPRLACRTAPPHMRAHHPPGAIAAGSPPQTRRRHSVTRHDPHMSRPHPSPGGGWEATPHAQPPRPHMRTTIGSGLGAVGDRVRSRCGRDGGRRSSTGCAGQKGGLASFVRPSLGPRAGVPLCAHQQHAAASPD